MKDANSLTVSTPTDREIVLTRTFNAPRSVVFEAWTTAEHVSQWWDPTGATLLVCEIDLRPMGEFRWVNRGQSGHTFAGIYREIDAPSRITFSLRAFPSSQDSLVSIQFTEMDGSTNLKMTIDCASAEDRNALLEMRIDVGTARTLGNLANYLRQMP